MIAGSPINSDFKCNVYIHQIAVLFLLVDCMGKGYILEVYVSSKSQKSLLILRLFQERVSDHYFCQMPFKSEKEKQLFLWVRCVFVCYGCPKKVPQTERPKHQKFIFSHFWRL